MKNNKGLTILEIIIILVIAGIAIPALLAAYATVVGMSADARSVTVATNIAQEKTEEIIKNKRFEDICKGQGDFVFDPNAGTANDICPSLSEPGDCPPTYGCSENNPNCYNYQIIVGYVDAADLDTPVTGTGADADDCDDDGFVDDATDFKLVQVKITKDGDAGFNVTLRTIITNLGY